MSRAERIYNILKDYDGKQVGGKHSTQVQVDFSLILQFMEYEDRIRKLEGWLRDNQDEIQCLLDDTEVE